MTNQYVKCVPAGSLFSVFRHFPLFSVIINMRKSFTNLEYCFSSAKLHFSPTREQRKVQYFFILTFYSLARNYSANPMMSTWSAPFGAEILQIYINLTNYLNDLDRFVRFLAVRRLLKGIRRIVTLAHPLASPHACGRIAQFIRLHQPIQ